MPSRIIAHCRAWRATPARNRARAPGASCSPPVPRALLGERWMQQSYFLPRKGGRYLCHHLRRNDRNKSHRACHSRQTAVEHDAYRRCVKCRRGLDSYLRRQPGDRQHLWWRVWHAGASPHSGRSYDGLYRALHRSYQPVRDHHCRGH